MKLSDKERMLWETGVNGKVLLSKRERSFWIQRVKGTGGQVHISVNRMLRMIAWYLNRD